MDFPNTHDYDREESPTFDIPNISVVEPALGLLPHSNDEDHHSYAQSLHLPPDMISGHHRSMAEEYTGSSGSEYSPSPSTSFRSLSPSPALPHDLDQYNDYEAQYTNMSDYQLLAAYSGLGLRSSRSSDSIHSLGSTNTTASNSSRGNTPPSSIHSSMEKLGNYAGSLTMDAISPQEPTAYDSRHTAHTSIPGSSASSSSSHPSGVSIKDMLSLLLEAGSSMTSKDPDEIRSAFINRLMLSGGNSDLTDFSRPAKMEIGTAATTKASNSRRKSEATFMCELCDASFTRKNGVMNHYRSHLGIADKRCMFCKRGFTTSLGRHIKKCKSNPNRIKPPTKKEIR